MKDDDLLTNLAQFIDSYESTHCFVNWHNDFLHIKRENGRGALVTLCSSEAAESALRTLISIASAYDDVEVLELYYAGEHISDLIDKCVVPAGYLVITMQVIDAWKFRGELLFEDSQLGNYVRLGTANKLRLQLKHLETGDGSAYEKLICNVFKFVLYPYLFSVKDQPRSLDGSARRDLVLRLKPGCFLQQHFRQAGLTANNIIVETKNQKVDSGEDIYQLARYISPATLASIGFLVTRKPLKQNLRKLVAQHRHDSGGKTIIVPLDDGVMVKMLDNAENGQFDMNERLLVECFEAVLTDTQ